MTQLSHDHIAQRSFMIWEQEGRPDGQALDHWLQAERELSDLFAKQALPNATKPVALKAAAKGGKKSGRKSAASASKRTRKKA